MSRLNINDPELRRERNDLVSVIGRVMEMARRVSSRTVLDPRTPEEIVGYDENGLAN